MFIYALPSLITAGVYIVLYLYILTDRQRGRVNRILGHIFFMLFLISLGDTYLILSGDNVERAFQWALVGLLGFTLVSWFIVYFGMNYPTEIQVVRNRLGLGVVYIFLLVNVVFYLNALFGYYSMVHTGYSIVPEDYGIYNAKEIYADLMGSNAVFTAYVIWMTMLLSIFAVIFVYRLKTDRKYYHVPISMIYLSFLTIMLLYTIEMALWLFSYSRNPFREILLTNIVCGTMTLIVVYTITKYRVLSVRPMVEAKSIGLKDMLEPGYLYAVTEDDADMPERSLDILVNHVKNGIAGTIITTLSPDKIRKKYGIEKVPIISITTNDTQKPSGSANINDIYMPISQIHSMADIPSNFMRKDETAIILIDGFGTYIAHCNTVKSRTQFLSGIRALLSTAYSTKTILLIPMQRGFLNTDSDGSIIRTKKLFGLTNLMSQMVFETMLNVITSEFKKDDRNALMEAFKKMSQIDPFFSRLTLSGDVFELKIEPKSRFSHYDVVLYLRKIIENNRKLPFISSDKIIAALSDYGIDRYGYDMLFGESYIVFTGSVDKAQKIFIEVLDDDRFGLYIGRTKFTACDVRDCHSDKIRTVWMSDVGSDEYSIPPRLEHIRREVEEFYGICKGKRCVVMLEGLVYLIRYTGNFDDVHISLSILRDMTHVNKGLLIVPVDRGALPEKDIAVLSQEFGILDYRDV